MPPRAQLTPVKSGVHVWTQFEGSGRVGLIVLIHAAGQSSASWDDGLIGAMTTRGYRVLLLDLRDSGQTSYSAREGPHYGLSDLAQDVLDVLDVFAADSVILLGAGLGAAVAQESATRLGHRCRLLVLLSPLQADTSDRARSAVAPNPAAVVRRSTFGQLELAASQVCVDYLVRYGASLAGSAFDPSAALRSAEAVYRHAADLAAQLTKLPRLALTTVPPLGADYPILVVHGTDDPALQTDVVSSWTAQQARARLLLLPGTGHASIAKPSWSVVLDVIELTSTVDTQP